MRDDREDPLAFFHGLVLALPAGAMLWMLLGWGAVLVGLL